MCRHLSYDACLCNRQNNIRSTGVTSYLLFLVCYCYITFFYNNVLFREYRSNQHLSVLTVVDLKVGHVANSETTRSFRFKTHEHTAPSRSPPFHCQCRLRLGHVPKLPHLGNCLWMSSLLKCLSWNSNTSHVSRWYFLILNIALVGL